MRIAYLVSVYPAVSHSFIRREVAGLRENGLEVATFSLRSPGLENLRTEADKAEFHQTKNVLPCNPIVLLWCHLFALVSSPVSYLKTIFNAWSLRGYGAKGAIWAGFYFLEAILLAAMLKRSQVERLHTHFANAGADVGCLAASYLGIPWSMTLHGYSDFGNPMINRLALKIAATDFTVCISDYGRAQAFFLTDQHHWNKLIVVRCGLEPTHIHPRLSTREDGPWRLLCVARLHKEKGHIGLLTAFKGLLATGVEATLTLIGDGPERDRIERFIIEQGLQGQCHLLGSRSEEEVFDELSRADCFVMASFMEGIPIVLMEAMASGVPVIAPRVAGIPELVEHGKTGLLFTPGCWGQLQMQLLKLFSTPALAKEFSRVGRDAVEADYFLEKSIVRLAGKFRMKDVE